MHEVFVQIIDVYWHIGMIDLWVIHYGILSMTMIIIWACASAFHHV